ncbi:hypothetical protein KAS50_01890 [bacterium]|nr:hypothetical protein [bacterium]
MILFLAFLLTGFISIVIGLIFIINPKLLIQASEVGNKIIFSDEHLIHYPRFLGFVLLIISVIILSVFLIY